ncbi:cobalamin-independent methionine synthase II family protein [Methylomonas methanica]|uniref:5-methyltetrahydropteroyltriglutamate--homocysteine methyltransferase n=1 Tax=Methylomonas methanica TaxID=421 RepID=A0A177MRK9_METMH|nr:cobalamin-independent methionine synthase II family protein [Methylomonas methanica]OAI08014.1 5-methyltetrahydropteroyltriglutamate--homocysteine methyltransferase [Methylomonas methanica]
MSIPTESIGSIPRPPQLLEALREFRAGRLSQQRLDACYDEAVRDTLQRFADTGSPVISDGEQTKSSFATYPLQGLHNIAEDGIVIPFADGHTRQLPRLTAGPFRYGVYAGAFVQAAKRYTTRPLKQAVISASALSLLYPPEAIDGYSREAFIDDLVQETVADIRGCLEQGAHHVQIDFTEGRLSVKLDPSKQLLRQFIDLNNRVLAHFTPAQRQRIGVHTCPGGDHDSTHSADVDYAELLPSLFQLQAGNFYMQMASEKVPEHVLAIIKDNLRPNQRVFIGVIDVLNPDVEEPELVRDRVLRAAEYIPLHQLGTTDDCGFSPFEDDTSTGRDTAFAKIKARVIGTELAAKVLNG